MANHLHPSNYDEQLFNAYFLIFLLRTIQDEGTENADGDKKDAKKISGTPLFDDEIDTKTTVKDKAEELRRQGCKLNLNSH